MFVIDEDNNIIITRGDSALMKLKVVRMDKTVRETTAKDKVLLTVKRNTFDTDYILQVAGDYEGFITIPSEATYNVIPGDYVFDVQLKTDVADSEACMTYTVVPTRKFRIVADVTR